MGDLLLDRLEKLRDEAPDRTSVELLRGRADGSFDAEAVTRAQWLDAAARFAGGLRARGVRKGDRVVLCLPTSRAFLDVFLGALWLGAVPVPVPSLEGFGRKKPFLVRVHSVLQGAKPSLVVADARTAAALEPGASVSAESLRGEPIARVQVEPGDTAFLQYTSGSTGEPRGVVVTHANLAANTRALADALKLTPGDRQATWLPLYHDMGLVGGLLTTASHGVLTSLLSPVEFILRPSLWLQAVSARKATLTVAPNFAYSLLARKVPDADLAGVDLSSLRAAVNGAEPIDAATAHAFTHRFAPMGFHAGAYLPVYGLAEATLAAAVPPLGRPWAVDTVRRDGLAAGAEVRPHPRGTPFIAVGAALPGHTITIVDPESGAPFPERRVGEIVVAGPSVSPGYFGDTPRSPPDTVRTGDLGYLAEGELFVIDRLKDMILVAGRGYSPADVERVVEGVEGVRRGRVVAFSVPDADAGTDRLIIVAEVREGGAPALQEAIARAVAGEIGLTPQCVLLVDRGELARTSSGKIMRRDARARFIAGKLRRTSAWRRLILGLRLRLLQRE